MFLREPYVSLSYVQWKKYFFKFSSVFHCFRPCKRVRKYAFAGRNTQQLAVRHFHVNATYLNREHRKRFYRIGEVTLCPSPLSFGKSLGSLAHRCSPTWKPDLTFCNKNKRKILLWAHSDSWRHLNMAHLNNGKAYLHWCTFVQCNIGSWYRPVHVLCSSQTCLLFSLQQLTTNGDSSWIWFPAQILNFLYEKFWSLNFSCSNKFWLVFFLRYLLHLLSYYFLHVHQSLM